MRSPALLLLLLPLGACTSTRPPAWELASDEVLVVLPFQDPDFRDRWDSPAGQDAAQETTDALSAGADFGVRPYEDVQALVAAEDEDAREPAGVARRTGADYALVCDFEALRVDDSLQVGYVQGRARVRVRLFRASDGTFVRAAQRTVEVVHPPEPEPFLPREEVRRTLLREVGAQVAGLYRKEPVPRGR